MKVKDSYYTPELNILAELKIAEAYFLDEQYIEAAVAYEAFLVSHPNNARVPDVLYQLGLSYSYQMLGFDQDQTATINALKAFTTLKERFPQDRRSEVLQTYIENCRNQLAASDLNIGQFYLVTKDYSAAINRIEGLLMKYPNFYNRDKAYFYLGQAYMMVGDNEKADMAFNTLFNDYSNSDYIPDARDFIETNQ
jgi:outer membrane protein assembly factor BamD